MVLSPWFGEFRILSIRYFLSVYSFSFVIVVKGPVSLANFIFTLAPHFFLNFRECVYFETKCMI